MDNEVLPIVVYISGFAITMSICYFCGATKSVSGQNATLMCSLIWPIFWVCTPYFLWDDYKQKKSAPTRVKTLSDEELSQEERRMYIRDVAPYWEKLVKDEIAFRRNK